MRQDTLPKCFESNQIEIYRRNGKLNVIINGNKRSFLDTPLEYREPFIHEYADDENAQFCLEHKMQVAEDRFEKFVSCRYGNFDNTPDLIDGITYPDAPNCEHEKTCLGFGIVCLIPGGLTPQQYFIARLIALGKQDKEIADELNIKLPTVRTHYTHIRVKLGVNNRNEIALWTRNKGIV